MAKRIPSALMAPAVLAAALAIAPIVLPTTAQAEGGGGTSRSCLSGQARALLERIEKQFGAMKIVSTCRDGATIAGTGRPSRHASGNAIDFDAGGKKSAVIEWLIANHHAGGTMTYADMDHVHVDIGSHFVSLAGGRRVASASRSQPSTSEWQNEPRMSLGARR